VLVVPSGSDANAAISAEAPLDTDSAKVLASESLSDTEPTLNSSTSVIVTVRACVATFPPASVAVTVSAHGFDAHVMDSKF